MNDEVTKKVEEDEISCTECDDYDSIWLQQPMEADIDLYDGLDPLMEDGIDMMTRSAEKQIALTGGVAEDEYLVEWAVTRGLEIEDPDLLLHKKSDKALAHLKKLGYRFIEI